ncbi:DNA-directed RNA polymerase subunit alpha C-terminal domain-containing protein [Chitinivibrio alkaliphilus]|uniref:RNA polymerase alpha subunit C-terminal domain-containing protein n=1 Tax=Chitinivibrio alkaliphilus ACht1 TaxID=1313304 RepID=U7D6N2_9BACT|nr:DNA-directed RNA polymerase subunit alpha C-terminal domain-containing protein [Chitinivibrio alkaliphilus]ERP30742.1 hypothetical protein CALK_2433 [Chitinivibrio alkaliphilus ACht1]
MNKGSVDMKMEDTYQQTLRDVARKQKRDIRKLQESEKEIKKLKDQVLEKMEALFKELDLKVTADTTNKTRRKKGGGNEVKTYRFEAMFSCNNKEKLGKQKDLKKMKGIVKKVSAVGVGIKIEDHSEALVSPTEIQKNPVLQQKKCFRREMKFSSSMWKNTAVLCTPHNKEHTMKQILESLATGITALSLKNHPFKRKGLEKKLLYIYGMVIVAMADKKFHEKEKAYIAVLLNTLEISLKELQNILCTVENDPDHISEEVASFLLEENLNNRYYFMLEAITVAYIDEYIHENEIQIIEDFFRLLKMNKIQKKKLFDIHNCLRKKQFKTVRSWAERAGVKSDALIEYHETVCINIKLYKEIVQLPLSRRVKRILKRHNFFLLGDLIKSKNELKIIRGIGKKSYNEILNALKHNGISIDMVIDGYPDKDFFTILKQGTVTY